MVMRHTPLQLQHYYPLKSNLCMEQTNDKMVRHSPLRFFIILAGFIVLALVLYFGIQALSGSPSKNNGNSNTQVAAPTFNFPQAFGDPRYATLTPTDGTGIVSSGKAEQITFSNNTDLYFILATNSFSGFKLDAYTGEQDFQTLCPKPSTFDASGNGCILKTLGGRQVLVRTEHIADEGVYNLVLTYSVTLTQGEYQGLKVIQSFPAIYSALNSATSDAKRQLAAVQYAKDVLTVSETSPFTAAIDQIETVLTSMKYNTTDV